MIAIRYVGPGLLLMLLVATSGFGDDRTAADLLPPSTTIYAEIPQPAALLELLEQHPLRPQLEQLQGIRASYETKPFLQFKAAVALLEAQLGQTWPTVLKTVSAGGMAIGVDSSTQAVAVLIKASDEQAAPRLLEAVIGLARAAAKHDGNADPVKSGEYRGLTAYQVDKARVVTMGRWLLVTNQAESGKAILDAYLDKPTETLASQTNFQAARSQHGNAATAWGYVNVEAIRSGGPARELFSGKTENPLAELLVGGMLDTLRHTPYVTASLTLDKQQTRLELAMPHQSEWTTEAREYYFGPAGQGRAAAPLPVENALLSLSTYRDLSTMWLRAGDLFQDKMAEEFTKIDSNLSTLFSGKDFGEEILGEVHPEMQLVVARQAFQDADPQPAMKLPAFAAIFRLKDAETIGPDFRRTYQNLIGFLNIIGAMNGQPQLDLEMEKGEAFQLVTATYLREPNASPGGLKIHYNFSPSVAFVGEHFIVSSTSALARELVGSVDQGTGQATQLNSTIKLNVSGVSDILHDNRAQLVAQNMLSEGRSKEEAELAIGDLLKLVALARSSAIDLATTDNALRLSWEIQFASE